MRKAKSKFPIKKVLTIFLCLCATLLFLFVCLRYLTSSDYFKLEQSEFFSGQNIFRINLSKKAKELSDVYPDYKKIILRRSLPDRIRVDFIPRQAVAILKLSEDFLMDEEGILFLPLGGEEKNLQLPSITGLSRRIRRPQSGLQCSEDSTLAILEFINNLNRDSMLEEQIKIKEINLANANDIFMFTTGGSKINLGSLDSLNKDLSILRKLSNEIDFDLTKVEYIDLRFREPVIKYR